MPRDRHHHRWARASADDGLSVVEVMVAITLLAFMMTAVASGIVTSLRATELGAERTAATQIATRVVEGVRATTWEQLLLTLGTVESTEELDGDLFDVVVDSYWVSVDTNGDPCETPDVPNASSVVRIEVDVSPQEGGIQPVHVETAISPPGGTTRPDAGTLIVRVEDHLGDPVPLAIVTAEGSMTGSLGNRVTRPNGCVTYGNVTPDDITVEVSKAGFVTPNDEAFATDDVEVEARTTVPSTLQLAPASSVNIVTTSFAGGIPPTGDGHVLQLLGGERNAVLPATDPIVVDDLWPSARRVVVGACPDADPLSYPPGQQGSAPVGETPLAAGSTTEVAVTYASVELEIRGFDGAASVVATNTNCPAGQRELRWQLDGDDLRPGETDRFLVVMPFGEWEFEVDGSTKKDKVKIRPADWDEVQSAKIRDK